MTVSLIDQKTNETVFDVNFWHWRAIVEAVRSLRVLPEETIATLHQPFLGELSAEDARMVASALRERLIPTLDADDRLSLDRSTTKEPDDGIFYRGPAEFTKNYSTNRRVLEQFARSCDACNGFKVS